MERQKELSLDVENFARQIIGMRDRLSILIDQAHSSPISAPLPAFIPSVYKELGVASEELEVAIEELRQQNETLCETLEATVLEQQRYQELFESLPEAYLITDLNGCIQEANQTASRLLGVPARYLIGKPLSLFIREADRSGFRSILLQQRQNDQPKEWKFCLESRDKELTSALAIVSTAYNVVREAISFRWLIREASTAQAAATKQDFNSPASPQETLTLEREILQTYPIHRYERGDIISLKLQTLWCVRQGLVKLTTITEHNEDILIGLLGEGMPFGAGLTALPTYQAIALSNVELISIPLTDVHNSVQLSQWLLDKTSQRLRQTEILLAIAGQRKVSNRLAQLLKLLKDEISEPVDQGMRLKVRLTHEDLANACCSTRVTITRLLGKFQKQGQLLIDSKNFIILT